MKDQAGIPNPILFIVSNFPRHIHFHRKCIHSCDIVAFHSRFDAENVYYQYWINLKKSSL